MEDFFVEVSTFEALVKEPLTQQINAVNWKRSLEGDFAEIVSKLTLDEPITEISLEELNALELSDAGKAARAIMLNDYQLLESYGAQPTINLLQSYPTDDEFDFISTDVYSFHIDRSPITTDTFLCTYHGTCSDIISHADAIKKVETPAVREQLHALHEGKEEDFEAFLVENYFDMHYAIVSDRSLTNLGQGNLWRLAVDQPGSMIPGCIHRAPKEKEGELRLLLIC